MQKKIAWKQYPVYSDIAETGNWHSLVGAGGLGVKYGIESVSGVLYLRMRGVTGHLLKVVLILIHRLLDLQVFFDESMSDEDDIEQPSKRSR